MGYFGELTQKLKKGIITKEQFEKQWQEKKQELLKQGKCTK